MKKHVCLLLVLVMLVGLFAGCNQPSTEGQPVLDTPEVSTSPPEKAPPRTPEEFLTQFNEALKGQNIPLEFSFLEPESEYDYYVVEADAIYTGSGEDVYTQALELWVIYDEGLSGPLYEIQINIAPEATQAVQDLYRHLSIITSTLCDRQMDGEKVEALHTAVGEPVWKLAYVDGMGFYNDEYWGNTLVLYQPNDLTHIITTHTDSGEQWYRIVWTEAGQAPFGWSAEMLYPAKGASYISVSELESGINENLANLGVPVECTLHPYCYYGSWRAAFRFTTLDDPDYSYPAPNLENRETQEEIEREFNRYFNTVGLDVTTIAPVSKEGPVTNISLSSTDLASWGDDFPAFSQAFSQVLMQAILSTCGAENGEAELEALYAAEPTEADGTLIKTLQKDQYILELHDPENEGYRNHSVTYPEFPYGWQNRDGLNGEDLLDPALLAYDLQVEGPMVKDGYFNTRQTYSGYFSNRSSGHISIGSAINDYLEYTRSEVSIGDEIVNAGYEAYKFFNGYGWSDDQLFDHDAYGLMIENDYMGVYEVFVYYNTNVEDYYPTYVENLPPEDIVMFRLEPETENILRIPIAVSLLLDEGMAEEEAVQLHTHEIPYDYEDVNEDGVLYRVTVYGPRDVVHILQEEPETGMNYYYCMPREYFDSAYSHLAEYLES